MFWDKKGDVRKLPDLPPVRSPLPILPQKSFDTAPEMPAEKHALPAFPDSPTYNKFSQAAIKDAISPEKEEVVGAEFPDDSKYKVVEMDKSDDVGSSWSPPALKANSFPAPLPPMPKPKREAPKIEEIPITPKPVAAPKTSGEVYIKLDKYHTVKKALIDAEKKVNDIDELLKRIRETKLREEQELAAWERDILSVKSRLKDVTEVIFEKVK